MMTAKRMHPENRRLWAVDVIQRSLTPGHSLTNKEIVQRADDLLAELARTTKQESCVWTEDTSCDYWESVCGMQWCFPNGGPPENKMCFCPGCGKPARSAR